MIQASVRAEEVVGLTGLRLRVLCVLGLFIVASFVVGAAVLYTEAVEDQHAIAHNIQAEAITTSNAMDREVTSAVFLLQGLSQSPALIAGDTAAFYDQLRQTPHPKGAWFVLWDMRGQVLNTRRPFGSELPTWDEIEGEEDGIRRIRTAGLSISNLVIGPVVQELTVSVHLRLDDPNSQMTGIMTMVLPQDRLNAIVRENPSQPGWTTVLLDRNLVPVATSEEIGFPTADLKAAFGEHLSASMEKPSVVMLGGAEFFVSAHQSALTGYSALTAAPINLVRSPVLTAIRQITTIGAVILVAGCLAGAFTLKQVAPVERAARQAGQRLRLAEAHYATLWDNAPDGLFVVAVTSTERFVLEGLNPAHERATGLSLDVVAGRCLEDGLGPEAAAVISSKCRECINKGSPIYFEEELNFPNGRRIWRTSLAPVRDPDSNKIIALVGTSTDITSERETTLQIENSRQLLKGTLDALPAHIAILDQSGEIVAVNRAWATFAEDRGLSAPRHGLGLDYLAICRVAAATDKDAAIVAPKLAALLDGGIREFRRSYRCGERCFQMTASRFTLQGNAHVVVAHEDITDLIAARKDARDIAGRLLSLQEDERQRIAADLHDSTVQHIVAAGLDLMIIESLSGDRPGVQDAVAGMRSSLHEAQKEIRTLSYLLYPPSLRGEGLEASIRLFVAGFLRRTGLQGTVSISGPVDALPGELQGTVLRVVQEALVNVYRHAQATKVTVSIRCSASNVHLRITDNGNGMPETIRSSAVMSKDLGVGIPGMRARIQQFNGTLTVASNSNGTTVRATVPIVPIDLIEPQYRSREART